MADLVPKAVVHGELPKLATGAPSAPLPADVVVLPTYKLYTPGQMALATFLGGPIAGFWLLGRNYKRLGKPGATWISLVVGVAAFGLLVAVAMALPGRTTSIPAILSIVLMSSIARGLQGDALHEHTVRGGRPGSWGVTVGVGFATLAIVVALVFGGAVGWFYLAEPPKLEFGQSEVYYDRGATEDEARAVGTALVDVGVLPKDRTASIKVTHEHDRATVTFIVTDEALHSDFHSRFFHDQAYLLSTKAFHDTPVDIQLADDEWTIVQRLKWEDRPQRVMFGNDKVAYRDGATEEEARTVGEVLVAQGLFSGDGTVVTLSRRGRMKMAVHTDSNTAEVRNMLHHLASPVSAALNGTAVDIVLVGSDGEEHRLAWESRPPDAD